MWEKSTVASRTPIPSRVLVVDDNATVRALVSVWLRREGHTVVEAKDGIGALNAFRRDPVQVVITDVGMPGVGGLELLAALRRLGSPPEVILLTASHATDAEAAVQALRLGAHDFIVKDGAVADALSLAVRGAAEKWRLREDNARLLRELRRLSVTDGLTGAGNRRALDGTLHEELARVRRYARELSVILVDLDHFKRVNDALGHRGGDEVLVSFTQRLRRVTRESDEVFRYGGEEFAVLLPQTGLDGAAVLAQRVVDVTGRTAMPAGHRSAPVTCSAGVAAATTSTTTSEALLGLADAALYAAKEAGRNRVFLSHGDGAVAPFDPADCHDAAAAPVVAQEVVGGVTC